MEKGNPLRVEGLTPDELGVQRRSFAHGESSVSRGDYMKRREICLKMSCGRIGQRRFGRSASSGSWMNEGSSGRKSSPESLSSSSIVTM